MKKKFIVFLATFALVLSLCACGGEESSKEPAQDASPAQSEKVPDNPPSESPKDEEAKVRGGRSRPEMVTRYFGEAPFS